MAITEADVQASLRALIDPNTGRDFVTRQGGAQGVRSTARTSAIDVVLGYPAKSQHEALKKLVRDRARRAAGRRQGRGDDRPQDRLARGAARREARARRQEHHRGGVAARAASARSTTAVNLALALAAEGATVGVLDADIYGPSQPMMLGIAGRPESKDGKTLEPLEAYGVQAMSIGFLIDADTPMVWRGPMVTQALEQLLQGHELARPRLPDRRPAAGHRRHPAHAGAEGAGHRRGHRHDAAGHRADRRAQGPQDVREGRRADRRHRREHDACTSARTAATPSTSSARAAAQRMCERLQRAVPRRAAARHPHPRAGRLGAADRRRRSRRRDRRDLPGDRAQGRGVRRARRPRISRRSFPNIVIQNT